MVMMLVQALGTDEDTFGIVAPGIMQSLQQSLNNPNDKLALVQALNATGHKAEDLTNDVMAFMEEVDKINSLSAQKKDFIKDFFAAYVNAINDTEGIAKRNVPVAIELCHPDAKIPQYAHISDSGADVYALEDITVHPGETVLVSTGLKVALLPGFELQVRPKSGRALKTKLRVANTPGTIDQTYRDEIKIIIENVEPPIKDITVDGDGKVTSILYGSDFVIGKGEKFCQLVLNEVPKASFYRVDSVLEIDKDDRNGGFGSSGLV
jgi:dUTP pyrophosphatase